jgi:hypothetical protein
MPRRLVGSCLMRWLVLLRRRGGLGIFRGMGVRLRRIRGWVRWLGCGCWISSRQSGEIGFILFDNDRLGKGGCCMFLGGSHGKARMEFGSNGS